MTHPFIVLEGIDGSGTTTQVERLVYRITKETGVHAFWTREPTSTRIGGLIRQALSREIDPPFNNKTLALLFAADRLDHVEHVIQPLLSQGPVLSDRYLHSSLFYQALTCFSSTERLRGADSWIKDLNRYALKPTITIVLDVPEEVAFERLQKRGGKPELFEKRNLQWNLSLMYGGAQNAVHVDGTQSIGEVNESIWVHVKPHVMRTTMLP